MLKRRVYVAVSAANSGEEKQMISSSYRKGIPFFAAALALVFPIRVYAKVSDGNHAVTSEVRTLFMLEYVY